MQLDGVDTLILKVVLVRVWVPHSQSEFASTPVGAAERVGSTGAGYLTSAQVIELPLLQWAVKEVTGSYFLGERLLSRDMSSRANILHGNARQMFSVVLDFAAFGDKPRFLREFFRVALPPLRWYCVDYFRPHP